MENHSQRFAMSGKYSIFANIKQEGNKHDTDSRNTQ